LARGENEAGRLAGIVPELPAGRTWKIEIHTRFSRGKELKDLRVITSGFTLAVPAARDEAGTPRAEEGGAASQAGREPAFSLNVNLHLA
jgi:hypothetical protein